LQTILHFANNIVFCTDPNFRVDADPDPDPENQNFLLLVTALPRYNVISFSSLSNVSYVFSILDSILKFSGKKSALSTFSFCLELISIPIRVGWIRISMPWMPIPFLIRPDPDPNPQLVLQIYNKKHQNRRTLPYKT
jgi:hypothetical protein